MAVVARLLRGGPLDVVAREANVSVAKLTEWLNRALAGAASALKERERADREDEITRLRSKVGEITMDPPRSPPWRQKAIWAEGGRYDEPDGLAFHVSFFMAWRGPRARGVFHAPACIAFSTERHRLRSPVAPVRQALVRMLTWPIISPGKSKRPAPPRKAGNAGPNRISPAVHFMFSFGEKGKPRKNQNNTLNENLGALLPKTERIGRKVYPTRDAALSDRF
jgi:hypothetical protein